MSKKKIEHPAHQRQIPGVCCARCESHIQKACTISILPLVKPRIFFCSRFKDHAGMGIIEHVRPMDRKGYLSPTGGKS